MRIFGICTLFSAAYASAAIRSDAMRSDEGIKCQLADPVLDKLDARTRRMVCELLDREIVTPALRPTLQAFDERIAVHDAEMVLTLGDVIARYGLTSVYGLGGRPDLAIKYQADCSLYERIHPLLMDYGLMDELRNSGLVPKVYMVSAPAPFKAFRGDRSKFEPSLEDAEKCEKSPRATVRFMVMERVPMSLFGYVDTFPNKVVPFEEAIRIVRNTIDGIERMHTRGIIHGDIHPGNVVMMNQEISQIAFIDFGMGFFAESLVAKPAISHEPLSRVHCYLSHYNLAGYRFSYRDDVYKAVMLLAYLLNGESFMRYCVMLQDYPEAMLQFKRDDFVFLLPGEADRIEALPILQDEKDLVRSCLRNILRLVRDIEPVDAIPRYGDIVAELVRIELIVHPKY